MHSNIIDVTYPPFHHMFNSYKLQSINTSKMVKKVQIEMNAHLLVASQQAIHPTPISMATTIISHILIRPNKSYAAYLCSLNNKTFKSGCASYSSSSTNGAMTAFSAPKSTRPCEHSPTTARRSGNYKPTIWDFDFIESLNSDYSDDRYLKQASELKARLMIMLEDTKESTQQLEFIDDLQRLGISYHFKHKIKQILTRIYEQKHLKKSLPNQGNLYAEALEFRLLRQHGFKVPQEVFDCFKNEKGGFETSLRINDTKGLLQLYEASHMLIEGESTLELAREFATNLLKKNLDDDRFGDTNDQNLRSMVGLALELPLHWRVQRGNSRLFIKEYEARPEDMNLVVLEFAKLDFNILQATHHQQELKHVSRWWRSTSLAEKLPFARDRLVECYFWTIGASAFEPQYGYSRVMLTKVNALITIIDDIYDVYGTIDELQLFTDVIQRWDIETMDQLPHYMQVCFLALNNFVNEMAYDVLTDQGFLIIPYLRKSWQDLCNAYLQEARWYYQNYTPTVEEYINHGWVSISAPVILTHAFFLVANPLEKNVVACLYKYHDIIRWSGMLLRLADDLGTSSEEMKRGDLSKLIQCYMKETSRGEKEAEEYVRFLIRETWKKMNKEVAEEVGFPHEFVRSAVDLGRMALYMYQHGDGHGSQNPKIKYRIESLLFQPIV